MPVDGWLFDGFTLHWSRFVDSRLALSDELIQTLVAWCPTGAAIWWTVSEYNLMFDSGPLTTCYENVMSFGKPELLNWSQCNQRRTYHR